MKILLIFPPLWDINLSPMMGPPILAGMLKEEGHEVIILDLNAKFMNFVTSKNFYDYFSTKIEYYKNELINLSNIPNLAFEEEQNKNYLYFLINSFNANKPFLENLYKTYPNIQQGLKNHDKTYTKNLNSFYQLLIKLNSKIFNKYYMEIPPEIIYKYKLFNDWEENIISNIINYDADLIGFSLYSRQQYDWTLNFSKKIKVKSNPTIVYGGSEILSLRNEIINKEIFNNNVDALIYGEGELTFKYLINNEIFENIPNLIYLNKTTDEIIINQTSKEILNIDNEYFTKTDNSNVSVRQIEINNQYKKIQRFYKPNYNGINFDEYFLPQKIINIESSRGCYWNKCEFCIYMNGSHYKQKPIEDLIEEIKEYVEKYNIKHFFFTDSAMHPDYARKFSKKILENNLKIFYSSYVRLEKEFDYDLLKQMYDSGFRIGLWGVESGSDRILQLYNKGTSVENNSKILKTAKEIGIYNFCWFMLKLPRETEEDLQLTRKFILNNIDIIDSIQMHYFALVQNAPIAKHPENFGLDKKDFDFREGYGAYFAPKNIVDTSEEIYNEITKLYQEKNNITFSILSNTLIQLSLIKE